MASSIKLQLSSQDCMKLEQSAATLYKFCLTSYNNVTQIFKRTSKPLCETILVSEFANHDLFLFPRSFVLNIHWSIKLISNSANSRSESIYIAQFNPQSINLPDLQLTDFRQIKWQIPLVSFQMPLNSPALNTVNLTIQMKVYSDSFIHQSPEGHVSPSYPAIFDHLFQWSRANEDCLRTTFRPQINALMLLDKNQVHCLPLSPLEPSQRLDILRTTHVPPARYRRSQSPYMSQYNEDTLRSGQPHFQPRTNPPPAPDYTTYNQFSKKRKTSVQFANQPGPPSDVAGPGSTPGPPPLRSSRSRTSTPAPDKQSAPGSSDSQPRPLTPGQTAPDTQGAGAADTRAQSVLSQTGPGPPGPPHTPAPPTPAPGPGDPAPSSSTPSSEANHSQITACPQVVAGGSSIKGYKPSSICTDQNSQMLKEENTCDNNNLFPNLSQHYPDSNGFIFQNNMAGWQQNHNNMYNTAQGYGSMPGGPQGPFAPARQVWQNPPPGQHQGPPLAQGQWPLLPNPQPGWGLTQRGPPHPQQSAAHQQQPPPFQGGLGNQVVTEQLLDSNFANINQMMNNLHLQDNNRVMGGSLSHSQDNDSQSSELKSKTKKRGTRGGKGKNRSSGQELPGPPGHGGQVPPGLVPNGGQGPPAPGINGGQGPPAPGINGGQGPPAASGPPPPPALQGQGGLPPTLQSPPPKYEIPQELFTGLVECTDFSHANIIKLLQGRIPPHLINIAQEANLDVANIRQMLAYFSGKIAQGTLTLEELNQVCANHEGCLARIRDTIGRNVLGEKWAGYALDASTMVQNMVASYREALTAPRNATGLNWSLSQETAPVSETRDNSNSGSQHIISPVHVSQTGSEEEFRTPQAQTGANTGGLTAASGPPPQPPGLAKQNSPSPNTSLTEAQLVEQARKKAQIEFDNKELGKTMDYMNREDCINAISHAESQLCNGFQNLEHSEFYQLFRQKAKRRLEVVVELEAAAAKLQQQQQQQALQLQQQQQAREQQLAREQAQLQQQQTEAAMIPPPLGQSSPVNSSNPNQSEARKLAEQESAHLMKLTYISSESVDGPPNNTTPPVEATSEAASESPRTVVGADSGSLLVVPDPGADVSGQATATGGLTGVLDANPQVVAGGDPFQPFDNPISQTLAPGSVSSYFSNHHHNNYMYSPYQDRTLDHIPSAPPDISSSNNASSSMKERISSPCVPPLLPPHLQPFFNPGSSAHSSPGGIRELK